jgi:hypothetical protein
MTEPKAPRDRLFEVQAMLLRRSMLTSDLLRWKMLKAGLTVDRPPDICDPETGAEPPDLETVIRQREEEEMDEDEIVKVPAVTDMEEGDFQRHLELRHPGVTSEARHTVKHAAGLSPDHIHKPDAIHRRAALQNDIRLGTIEPSTKETMYVSGYDEWGPE